ncbi:MAG: 2-C-methyl-D-erythritol 4-phosphate cytidylyltransferase [Holophagales bacterium]|nr:MAG: 2-C-methyl-D-erythritol 4-phosphate cytidylyltransferase [Holophagales bacterium]
MGSLVVLVPAGGRGERFGAAQPKQLLSVGDRPVLQWTLERLLELGPAWLTVALPAGVELPVQAWNLPAERVTRVDGGATRQQSVVACLAATPGSEDDLVIVHDGARPATAREDLAAVIAAARESGAAVLGRAISDTVKRLEAERIVATVDRRALFRAETPQVFRRDLLTRAFAAALQEGRDETDESAAVERLGGIEIRAVYARYANPKLTFPADLARMTALLGDRA